MLWEEVSDVGIAIASNSVQSDPANNGKHIQLGSVVGYVLSGSPSSEMIMYVCIKLFQTGIFCDQSLPFYIEKVNYL